ncbi:hypothetical protein WJX73_009901 [Symbiochloris irregularis]|uniref:carnosine N-methyltransferase n=1 Tax=Symbiochloris irregularis TaxID=706552 RepID=A0AAW1PZZ9_9CHLO
MHADTTAAHTHDVAAPEASEEDLEQQALSRIIHAFQTYAVEAEGEVARWEKNIRKLSPELRAMVPELNNKPGHARKCIMENASFFDGLVAAALADGPGQGLDVIGRLDNQSQTHRASPNDVDKVRYVLKNLVRDWSEEGAAERAQSYGKICTELRTSLGNLDGKDGGEQLRVLVPGAGIGRLCVDIASMGFHAQGNEFSYYMLLSSAYVLNHMEKAGQHTIYPWLHSNCNQMSDSDQLRQVHIPDRAPADILKASSSGSLSMVAGDFVEVYGDPKARETFHAVTTCFFIDTAHNIFEYLDVIWHVLKMGGHWINLGPLLYHWADAHTYLPTEEMSIELPLDQVEKAAKALGFHLVRKQMVPATFNVNPRSMLQTSYNCVFWTMVKVPRPHKKPTFQAAYGINRRP